MPRFVDMPLAESVITEQAQRFRSLVDGISPTPAQRDLMVRAWIDRLGAVAASAVDEPGVEVYVPLRTVEVEDGFAPAKTDEAMVAAAQAAILAAAPTTDDLRQIATDVLGAGLVAALDL